MARIEARTSRSRRSAAASTGDSTRPLPWASRPDRNHRTELGITMEVHPRICKLRREPVEGLSGRLGDHPELVDVEASLTQLHATEGGAVHPCPFCEIDLG